MDGSALGRFFTARLGAGGSSLVFGFGYGLFPGFLAALFGGSLLAERPVANSLVTGAVVFLLASPVIYLQSAPFTSGVVVSWIAGTAAGALCGVWAPCESGRESLMLQCLVEMVAMPPFRTVASEAWENGLELLAQDLRSSSRDPQHRASSDRRLPGRIR